MFGRVYLQGDEWMCDVDAHTTLVSEDKQALQDELDALEMRIRIKLALVPPDREK